MKKHFITILCLSALSLGSLTAQENAGKNYLPQAGDFAFGINAKPLFQFFGNMFYDGNGSTNTLGELGGEPAAIQDNYQFTPDVSLMGKYFISDEMALRANIGIIGLAEKTNYYSRNDSAAFADPLSEAKVTDSHSASRHGGSVALGIEFRRGTGRIQGYAGADLMYAYVNYNYSFSYGNAVTEVNQTPSRTDFASMMNMSYVSSEVPYETQTYLTDVHSVANQRMGLRGFAGVEYFLAPKLSLGAEVYLGAYWVHEGATYYSTEGFNTLTQAVETRTNQDCASYNGLAYATGSFSDRLGGNLYLMFYF